MPTTQREWCDYRKGESRIESGKYILVYCPDHPYAKSKGHVYEHRYIMEKFLKRFLSPTEHVHHKNGDGKDNRIENLEIIGPREHALEHWEKRLPCHNLKGILALNKYAQSIKLPRDPIVCGCGCGMILTNRDKQGRSRKFIQGHNARGQHWRWKRGR